MTFNDCTPTDHCFSEREESLLRYIAELKKWTVKLEHSYQDFYAMKRALDAVTLALPDDLRQKLEAP